MKTLDPDIRSEVRRHMKVWSKWRRSGRLGKGIYWPSKSITGRFLDGMKGNTCPVCKGHQKAPGRVYKRPETWVECQRCNGTGRVKLNGGDNRINPAFIRESFRHQGDPLMLEIDRAICELRRKDKKTKEWMVLWTEYNHNGTQKNKAINRRLTYKQYRIALERGHIFIYESIKKILHQGAKSA